MQVMRMRLMSKGEYLIVPKGTKFTGAGKLGLNLFLQKCKKQHLDKLKEVKTPWVLDGTPSSYHLMIAYHTKS